MKAGWSPEMTACWDRLIKHEFDEPEHRLSFTDRLARDNGWTIPYAAQVIEEYRRFCFLAIHAGHPVTPSDDVDQAWHLHLTYTRDYWERFCADVLRQSLHHGPTRGGTEEGGKYRDWYEKTLESYAQFFGARNADVWPEPNARFADADRFVRLNQKDVLVLTPSVILFAAFGAGAVTVVAGIFAMNGSKIALGVALTALIVTGILIIALPVKRGHANTAGGSGVAGCGGGSGCSSGCGGGGCGGG